MEMFWALTDVTSHHRRFIFAFLKAVRKAEGHPNPAWDWAAMMLAVRLGAVLFLAHPSSCCLTSLGFWVQACFFVKALPLRWATKSKSVFHGSQSC